MKTNRRGDAVVCRVAIALAIALAVGVIAAGCATTASPTPEGTGTPASPFASPTADGSGGPCRVVPQDGALRSNTLVNMTVGSDGVSDRVSFTFGPIAPGPTGGTGRLTAVTPPFTQAGSGQTVTVLGTHFVELHLDGMLIADDAGNEVYGGETSVRPNMIAIKDIEETDGFEGVYNFVIGYDGNGCVGLVDDEASRTLTITIGH